MSKDDKPTELVPRLRFPEFRKDAGWTEKPLEKILTYEQPGSYIVETSNYGDSGTPVLTANKSFVLGYTDESDGIYTKLPAVIFDDFTTDSKYVGFPFKIKSSAIKILTKRHADDELGVIYELMRQIRFDPTQHKRYYISEYQHIPIPLPKPAEQRKIAECLGSLDDWIAAETRALAALRQHKTGLMQQLFPRPGETRPRLRFPEFRDKPAWQTAPGNDLFELISNKASDSGLPVLAITQEHGAVPRDQIDYHVSVSNKSIESYKEVCPGDFIISLRSFQGGIEHSDYHGICSPAYIILRKIDGGPTDFYRHLFKTDRYITQLTRNLEGLRDGKMISYKQFSDVIHPKPSPAEQRKIAECLGSLDDWIAAETRALAALRQHKTGLMQQLFPSPEDN